MMNTNPYAAPQLLSSEFGQDSTPVRPVRAAARWTLICVMSAAPSFFWGCGLHNEPQHLAGMLTGIGVFVLLYTVVECTQIYHRLMRKPYVYRTVLIGYGTRVAISVIFPIGLTLDMLVGIASVSIVEDALVISASVDQLDYSAASFVVVFLTTLLQGIFLNAVLFSYMTIVYGVQIAFGALFIRRV